MCETDRINELRMGAVVGEGLEVGVAQTDDVRSSRRELETVNERTHGDDE